MGCISMTRLGQKVTMSFDSTNPEKCPIQPSKSNSVTSYSLIKSVTSIDSCQKDSQIIEPIDICLAKTPIGVNQPINWECVATATERVGQWISWDPKDGVSRDHVRGKMTMCEQYNKKLAYAFIYYPLPLSPRYRDRKEYKKTQKQNIANEEKLQRDQEIASGLGIYDDEIVQVNNPMVLEARTKEQQQKKLEQDYKLQEAKDSKLIDELNTERQKLKQDIEIVQKQINNQQPAPQRLDSMDNPGIRATPDQSTPLNTNEVDDEFGSGFGSTSDISLGSTNSAFKNVNQQKPKKRDIR